MLLRGNQTQAVNSGEHTHIIPESLACQNQIRHFFGERLQATNLWLFEEHCFCLNIYLRFSFGVWPMDDSTWCLGLAYCRQHDTLSSTHAASAETERHRTTEHKCTKIANFRENSSGHRFTSALQPFFVPLHPEALGAHSVYQHGNVCLLHSTHFAAIFSFVIFTWQFPDSSGP